MHIVAFQDHEVISDGLTAGGPPLRVRDAQAGGLAVMQECGLLPRRCAGQLLAQAGGVWASGVPDEDGCSREHAAQDDIPPGETEKFWCCGGGIDVVLGCGGNAFGVDQGTVKVSPISALSRSLNRVDSGRPQWAVSTEQLSIPPNSWNAVDS